MDFVPLTPCGTAVYVSDIGNRNVSAKEYAMGQRKKVEGKKSAKEYAPGQQKKRGACLFEMVN